MEIQIRETCPRCQGRGAEAYLDKDGYLDKRDCPMCQGSGQRTRWIPLGELARLLAEQPASI